MAGILVKRLIKISAELSNVRSASSGSAIKFSDLQIVRSSQRKKKPDSTEDIAFGACFSDHMLEIKYNEGTGWGKPLISGYHNLSLSPAAKVLHYASEAFEGMKAYRGVDGKIRLFRPELNMERLSRTAERASLPNFDTKEFMKCIKKLVQVDNTWVLPPTPTQSYSLYIRPTLIGTEGTLGIHEPNEALLYVISCVVGNYFETGFKPVSLLADPKYVRAWKGGCGSYKMGSNYASTVEIQKEARKKNCAQVLWLYGEDHLVTEVGTMNFFLVWINEKGEKELVTPDLSSGLILPGITRQSLLELAHQWDEFNVVERPLYMKEIVQAIKENRLLEMFGSGTACVVTPIASILYNDELLEIPTVTCGVVTRRFYETLTDIQYGKISSPWAEIIEEPAFEDSTWNSLPNETVHVESYTAFARKLQQLSESSDYKIHLNLLEGCHK